MISRSIVAKLWITILAFVLIIFLIFNMFIFNYFENYYADLEAGYLENLNVELKLVFHMMRTGEFADNFNFYKQTFIIIEQIISANGTLLEVADTDDQGLLILETSRLIPAHLKLISEKLGDVTRLTSMNYSDLIRDRSSSYDFFVLTYPIYDHDGKIFKTLVFFQSLKSMHVLINDLRRLLLLFVMVAALFTTVFAFLLSYRVAQPIREMTSAAKRLSLGDFKTRVKVIHNDEIGQLGDSFNQMAHRLEENMLVLSSEKDKLASVLSSMADSVITLNTQGEIIMINPPGERLLNWSDQAPEFLTNMLHELLEKGKNIERMEHLDGKSLIVIMAPLFFGEHISGAVTLLRDVTYEQKLFDLRQDFLTNVSHELRTPISMIRGYTEAIIDNVVRDRDELNEIINIIYEESLRVGRLVNDLLDLAGMEFELNDLKYTEINIKRVIDKVIKKFVLVDNAKNINIIADYDELPDFRMEIDVDRIEQVLTNLIDNAIRYSEQDGLIRIKANLKSEEQLMLEVIDYGLGIIEEDIPFIFERFYKTDKARTRGHSGMGLGLSIVKNIIDSHKGSITVHANKPKGLVFTIILPIKKKIVED